MATLKQKLAVRNLVENHGNVSKAMRDAWYPDVTAKNPKNLTESKWYKEELNKYIPRSLILGRLKGWIERLDDKEVLWHLHLASKIQGMQKDNVQVEWEIQHSYKIEI